MNKSQKIKAYKDADKILREISKLMDQADNVLWEADKKLAMQINEFGINFCQIGIKLSTKLMTIERE